MRLSNQSRFLPHAFMGSCRRGNNKVGIRECPGLPTPVFPGASTGGQLVEPSTIHPCPRAGNFMLTAAAGPAKPGYPIRNPVVPAKAGTHACMGKERNWLERRAGTTGETAPQAESVRHRRRASAGNGWRKASFPRSENPAQPPPVSLAGKTGLYAPLRTSFFTGPKFDPAHSQCGPTEKRGCTRLSERRPDPAFPQTSRIWPKPPPVAENCSKSCHSPALRGNLPYVACRSAIAGQRSPVVPAKAGIQHWHGKGTQLAPSASGFRPRRNDGSGDSASLALLEGAPADF